MRGARVVEQTLAAALEELSQTGYAAMRIEDVAARARVNKTTIYRRWPTKQALVGAALLSIAGSQAVAHIPDTGSVREDLLAHVRDAVTMTSSPAGRTILRMLAAERPDPEVLAIARSIRASHKAVTLVLLKRAQARGELRADLDPKLFLDVLGAAHEQLVVHGDYAELSESTVREVAKIVDLLLRGALSSPPGRSKPGRRPTASPKA